MLRIKSLSLIPVLVFWLTSAEAREPFTIDTETIEPGDSRSFMLPAPGDGIPTTVIHGRQEGPVLTLTAGVHGDEYPSIFALQQLRKTIDPASLRGTLVLVHLANLPGFHARRIAVHPQDEKNLNREFPGDPQGTPTEQLADYITKNIIPVTDYLIDLHSGSAYQSLLPHVYAPVLYEEPLDSKTLAFAKATGLKHVVLYDERPKDPANSISYPNTAQLQGKPSLTVEIGHLALRDPSFVDATVIACRRAMEHLNMLTASSEESSDAIIYSHLQSVKSNATGIFTPKRHVGDRLKKGDLIGVVTDYFGDPLMEVLAPEDGTLLMLHDTPPIKAEESPATLGIVKH